MSDRNEKREKWMAAAEAREAIRGNKPERIEAYSHAGMVGDGTVRQLLSKLKEHYDPHRAAEIHGLEPEEMPATVEQADLFDRLVRTEGTETLTRGIHQGDVQMQSFAVGDPSSRSDISGIKAISRLEEIVGRKAPILYIFGEPGSGKTNFAMLLSQLWKRSIDEDEAEIGSNIATWEEADEWLPRYGALTDWLGEQTETMESGGITQTEDAVPRLFVFDEASSHASGRGKSGAEAGEKLGPLVYKIRKARCGIIIIGHDGRDVHPAVRELSTVVRRYRGKLKEATVYESIKNREGVGQIASLNGIPETDCTYDDKEATSWSWAEAPEQDQIEQQALEMAEEMAEEMVDEEKRRLAAQLDHYEPLDLDQSKIGQALGGLSQGWVSKWSNRYEDEDLPL